MRKRLFGRGQAGFTLVELIVAIPISAIVVAAATAGLMQLLDSKQASAHMLTMRQVQTAGYWMSTDGLQAETVTLTAGDNVTGGFPLTLVWTDPNDDTRHAVRYTVTGAPGNMALQRRATITDIANPGTPTVTTTTVARNLTQVTCGQTTQDGQTLLIFTVTARVDQETESRIYEIKPRSLWSD